MDLSTIIASMKSPEDPSPADPTISYSTSSSLPYFDPFYIANTSVSSLISYSNEFPTSPFTTQQPLRSTTTASNSWSINFTIQIPLYTAILMLSMIGNSLVVLTLIHNRRMRTITNVFLMNLAISDILLGALCMPFTLTGAILRDFIFGEFMCKILPFLQGKKSGIFILHFTAFKYI